MTIPIFVSYPDYVSALLEQLNSLYERKLINKSVINRVNMLIKNVEKYENKKKLRANNIKKLLEYEINLKLILHL